MTRTARMSTEHIYKFIVDYQRTHGGVPPTYKQIGEFAGISHKGPVAHHLAKLKDQGLVSSDESGRSYATGGIWLSPKDIEALTVVYRNDRTLSYPGDDGGFWKTLWRIVGKPSVKGLSSWTHREPVVRGEDLEDEPYKPNQLPRSQR